MKRILVLLTVVALMVGMLAMAVTPGFADRVNCPGNNGGAITSGNPSYDPTYDDNGNGIICRYDRYDKNGFLLSTRYKDDHPTV